jgi:hypothetical protein
MTSRSPRTKANSHACVFSTEFVRTQVDPRVLEAFEACGKRPKFGDLRQQWRRQHCAVLNPYSSSTCPYAPEDCALAFLTACQRSADKASPVGYFRKIARSMALDRAENKPLERERERPGNARAAPIHPEAGSDVRSPQTGPTRIGALLGSLNLGPYPRPERDGRGEAEGEE